jgi:hypothetical protein
MVFISGKISSIETMLFAFDVGLGKDSARLQSYCNPSNRLTRIVAGLSIHLEETWSSPNACFEEQTLLLTCVTALDYFHN